MNYYDFSKDPIDEVDALAKDHDMAYATLAEGYEGWFNDEGPLKQTSISSWV